MPTFAATRRFLSPIAAIFQPPFAGLWIVALLYYAWCFVVYPDAQIWRGNLPDTDDYMYLNQLLDWLKGQGWYDNIQHRLDPPTGVPIHFSRLAQVPMALFTLLFEKLGLPPRGAATLMALLWPLVLLGFFFKTLRWAAESVMPEEWAGVTAYIGLFATGTMFLFAPGHIDHHGLIVIIDLLALGCVLRMTETEEDVRWALSAGFLLALGLTLALEILPWLLLISAFVGLRGAVVGGKAARNGLAFGLMLYLGSVTGLLLTRPPEQLFVTDVLSYSVTYVILAAGIAVALAGAVLAPAANRWVRMALFGALGLGTGTWFLSSFPDLIKGPYGGMDPALAQSMLGEISEASPLIGRDMVLIFLAHTGTALVAIPATIWFFARAGKEERWRWGLIAVLLATAFGLAVFYQRRFAWAMDAFAVLPLSVLLWRGWLFVARIKGRGKVYAEIGLLLLVGPLPLVLMPALVDGRSLNKGILLFPALSLPNACDMFVLENLLKDPSIYGDRPRLIINTMPAGPELLFRTPHKVLAAPFHMDVNGNLDATRFFSTPYPAEAEAIARRRHADLVIACTAIPEFYLRAAPGGDKDSRDFAPHFIERLAAGEAPDWLKRKRFNGLDNYVVYEVVPPASVPSPRGK